MGRERFSAWPNGGSLENYEMQKNDKTTNM